MENAPIFVKIDEYKEIMQVVDVINEKIGGIKTTLTELSDIKTKEDEQIKDWNKRLASVSEKMGYINASLKEM